MKFSLDKGPGNTIQSYAVGKLMLRMQHAAAAAPPLTIQHSVVVTPSQLLPDWPPQTPAELQQAHLQAVLNLQPELILLGTGARLEFPDAQLLACCHAAGVGIDVMDTGAACRTYNVLASEGRQVAAALFMIRY